MDNMYMIIIAVAGGIVLLLILVPVIWYLIKESETGVSERKSIRFMDVVEENKQQDPSQDQCAARIAGGILATGDQVPYLISLRHRSGDTWSSFCGGSLITYVYVLTAAHCLYEANLKLTTKINTVRIVTGADTTDITHDEFSKLQTKTIKNFWGHPKYEPFINDIALLEATSKFELAHRVKPIRMRGPDVKVDNLYCLLAGFGTIKTVESHHLRMVCMHVLSTQHCYDTYSLNQKYRKSYVCAGGGGKDAGAGDSGGPLVCSGYQVGLVTFGSSHAKVPGVYMNVQYYMDPELTLISKAVDVTFTIIIIVTSLIVSVFNCWPFIDLW